MSKAPKQPTVGRALLPLIIIPITIVIDFLLADIGYAIDKAMYNPPADMPSFMIPVFTLIMILVAGVVSIIALIVMIILIVRGLSKVSKAKKSQSYE